VGKKITVVKIKMRESVEARNGVRRLLLEQKHNIQGSKIA
jgi:hypothetical protein